MRRCRPTRVFMASQLFTCSVFLAAIAACGGEDGAPEPLLILSEESITFDAEEGGGNPPTQTVEVTTDEAASISDLAAIVSYGTGQPTGWLNALLSSPSTPSTLTLGAQVGSLAPANYTANVAVSGADAGPRMVAVTLRVGALLGHPNEFADGADFGANALFAQPFTVATNAILGSVNLRVKEPLTAGSQVKIGIYSAGAAGVPAALVAAIPATNLVVGRNEIPVTASLAAGTYWFAFTLSHITKLGVSPIGGGTSRFTSHTFTNALPATFPTHTAEPRPAVNWFVKAYAP